MKKTRILFVIGSALNFGGIEMFVMNIVRNINSDRFVIDLLITDQGEGYFDQEFLNFGGNIYNVPSKRKNIFRHYFKVFEIIKKSNYDVVHSHLDSMNIFIILIAKLCGIKVRISHSHNTDHLTKSKLKYQFHEILRLFSRIFVTNFLSCSEEAGKWLFGENIIYDKRFKIVRNAIDQNKFLFDLNTRNVLRRQLGISDKIVLGHVGRLDYQKNHIYLFEILTDLLKLNPNFCLVLVGSGPSYLELTRKCFEYNIEKNVIFLGAKPDVNRYYNIFDVFCFPSHFEGLGISIIEAQVNGLTCIVSDKVPKEVDITGKIKFVGIGPENQKFWIENIVNVVASNSKRMFKKISLEYSIDYQIKVLEKLYDEILNYEN